MQIAIDVKYVHTSYVLEKDNIQQESLVCATFINLFGDVHPGWHYMGFRKAGGFIINPVEVFPKMGG
jgi:hypothetical protein